ncbi:chemotaxis protein [Xaviernesmea oryzae]|uniref:Chemotaxis protein methyltransferase n=1 Tax=Xaviernesmea oryzae TaxID=464029 RepID=A0A1Q9B1D8_9HYPH|nr:protein-glutamate O-methyltransferase CheR [Xaviernesmea oryzae]OLP61804.1 chemotaxis protein [Xaviernesmea oryzae]SEL76840.1 chemotaxis protein methyltransferase CheR [Xaviernesmea oryzae]
MTASTTLTTPVITEQDFARFAEYFYRRTGILFEANKRYFVDKRLIDRINATQSGDFASYFRMLRLHPSGTETQILTNMMTVNETYFFREAYQFDCLTQHVLDEVLAYKQPGDPIRIWCMPCSTGEEAYSIAIHLMECWPKIDRYDVELLASDIDTAVLDSARNGIYSPRSVQGVTPARLSRYFQRLRNGNWQISEDLRHSVDFVRANLNKPEDLWRFSRIDVVFCRNLLIYFDDMSRRAAAQAFFQAMSPGAFICLGHSESMSRISGLFKVRKFGSTIVYQKPLFGETA